jgi:predicted nucleotide-binding protein
MTRRSAPPKDSSRRRLTSEEMRNGIARLEKRIQELTAFDPQKMTEGRPADLKALSTSINTTLERIFGDGTTDYRHFSPAADLQWSPGIGALYIGRGGGPPPTPLSDFIRGVDHNCKRSLALLQQAVQTLKEDLAELQSEPVPNAVVLAGTVPAAIEPSNRVFLVHGRDDAAKNEVALFLRAIDLEPIILHLRPNAGRHLLTKFRDESEGAGFAVVLMTPDDEGGLAGGADCRPRARQNVVFELGFFIGKLGPASVAALMKDDVEKPSDFDGIAYIPFDPSGRWKTDLARELHHAKVPFDPAKALVA